MKRIVVWYAAMLAAVTAGAQVPPLINYQGRLMLGTNLVNGTVGLSLRLYDAPSGGSTQYEDSNAVVVVDGLYSTFIGDNPVSGSLAAALTNAEVWLETAVNGMTLAPRERIVSVAYALGAQAAQTARLAGGVVPNAITASMLATGAVQAFHLATGAVGSAAIADGAVGAADLGSNAVTTTALADGAVTAVKIRQVPDVLLLSTIPDPAASSGDSFGSSVAAAGSNRFVVGARDDNAGGSAWNAGSAHVFDLDGHLVVTVTNPAPAVEDYFGDDVAGVGSNRFVVGAWADDAGATNAGSAYLYDLDGHLLATITNPAPAPHDRFGISVAGVGSDRIAVGAYCDSLVSSNEGSVYLYDLDGHLLATITNPAPAANDGFGSSVARVGSDRFVVGAWWDDAGATDAGSAYLFDLDGHLLATVANPTPEYGDLFGGRAAGVGSNRFVVGAYGDNTGAGDAGSAYIYDRDGNLLATLTNPSPAYSDAFGFDVAAVGSNYFLVGAVHDSAPTTETGVAYLYDLDGRLLAAITNPTPYIADYFGCAVAGVAPDRFVVGAYRDDTAAAIAGSVYLYELRGTHADGLVAEGVRPGGVSADMLQDGAVTTGKLATGAVGAAAIADGAIGAADLGANAVTAAALANGAVTAEKIRPFADVSLTVAITNPAPTAGDAFGEAVARVGSDRFVVGAPWDNAGAPDAGSAYLYDRDGIRLATITNPAPATNDRFGDWVAGVGADRFVVGAPLDDAPVLDTGTAYLYDRNGTLLATITNPTPGGYDYFGSAIAGVGSNRFVVGAYYDSESAMHAGIAYLYDVDGTLLATITNPIPWQGDHFGSCVAGVGSNCFVVGASHHGAGSAYLFDFDGHLLTSVANAAASNSQEFGSSAAAVGSDRFVVGARADRAGAIIAGSVHLFDLAGNLLASITNPAPGHGDFFGSSVAALGSDRFIVGAEGDDAGATNAGSAYLYDRDGVLLWSAANPAPTASIAFGYSAAGVGSNRFVVGAYFDATGQTNGGRAYLFEMPAATYVQGLIAEGVRPRGVTADMLAHGAVGADQLAAGAVQGVHLATGAVGAAAIATGAVGAAAIADGAIGAADLGSNAVTTAALADRAVSAAKIEQAGDFSLQAAITNPVPTAGDYFGWFVARVGAGRFVVGARSDDAGATDAGSVYLYNVDGTLLATITNPTPAGSDYFGWSGAGVGTNRFIVGARSDDAGGFGDAGSVYLYDLNGILLATITNPAPAGNDRFGASGAGVGASRFVVGAISDDAGASDAGSAYLYDLDGTLLATITNPAPAASDYFGVSVAGVGSSRFVVGAYFDDAGAMDAGSAYLYDLDGTLLATITNPTPAVSDYFGLSVAGVGPDRFVVGAYGDDASATNAGSAYLYDIAGHLLATIANPSPGADDLFGYSVAGVGSDGFAVGAIADYDGATNVGKAYLYDFDGHLLATVTNPAPAEGDNFGTAIAGVGSNRFVVGARYDDAGASDAGSAYLYEMRDHGAIGLAHLDTADVDTRYVAKVGGSVNRLQGGAAVLGSGTNAHMVFTVPFPVAFSTPPTILATPRIDTNVNPTFAVTVREATATNFTVNIHRVDTNIGWSVSLTLDWLAWE